MVLNLKIDRVGNGRSIYKRGFKNNYNAINCNINTELKDVLVYLKNIKKSEQEIMENFDKILKDIYGTDKDDLKMVEHKFKFIKSEYEKPYILPISITDSEIDLIKSFNYIEGIIVFFLLCRYKTTTYTNVRMIPQDINLILPAGLKVSSEQFYLAMNKILSLGYIGNYMYKNHITRTYRHEYILNKKLIEVDGNKVVEIKSLGNFQTLYDYVIEEVDRSNYIFCSECGEVVLKISNKSNNFKYCNNCACEIKNEKIKNIMRKSRKSKLL